MSGWFRGLLGACLIVATAAAQQPQQPQQPQQATPEQDPPQQDEQQARRVPVDVEAEQLGLPIRELTLGDALRLGSQYNVSLKVAELLPEQARLDVVFAEAGFLPELYGNTGYEDSQSPERIPIIAPSLRTRTLDATLGWRQRVITGGLFDLAFQPTRFESDGGGGRPSRQFQAQWQASFRQPLLRGAWTDYNLGEVTSARYRMTQARHDFDRTVQDTLQQIVEAYWELAFARQNWLVVDSALVVAIEQLRITDERIRVEELAPRDRIADRAEVARRREELIVAENAIRDREDDLRQLLFDASDSRIWRHNLRPVESIDVEPAEELPTFESLVETALQNRPDLRSLRSAVAAAEVAATQAERDMLPQLDLVSTYSADGVSSGNFRSAFSDTVDQEFPDWSVRLEFAIPIGNHAARSRMRRAQLEVERQRRLLHAATVVVTQEVRAALRAMTALGQSITASRESVVLAESNLDTERIRQRVGASTVFEVQRRNQELREARSRLLRNQLDYRAAESRLLYVQGQLQVQPD